MIAMMRAESSFVLPKLEKIAAETSPVPLATRIDNTLPNVPQTKTATFPVKAGDVNQFMLEGVTRGGKSTLGFVSNDANNAVANGEWMPGGPSSACWFCT